MAKSGKPGQAAHPPGRIGSHSGKLQRGRNYRHPRQAHTFSFWDIGVRVSELVAFRMKDYWPRNSPLMDSVGKGEKHWLMPINDGEQEGLNAYLEDRDRKFRPLFLGITRWMGCYEMA
ncbi:MAG: hypothetical protein R6U51_04920 [Anaerolineales bacterium]